jgi:hypothetical protein
MATAMARVTTAAVTAELARRGVLAKRVAIVIVTAGLALGSAMSAMQMITRAIPGAVPLLRSNDPIALTTDAEVRLSTVQENPAQVGAVANLAARSLTLQALNPVALRQLAMARVLAGQKDQEAPLMVMSTRVSRHDLGAQLWLIDTNVRRDDIPAVLKSYDTALRTNANSWPILFPLLNVAIEEHSIQQGLRPYWSRPSSWRETFIAQAIASSPYPDALATMAMRDGMLAALKDRKSYERNLVAALLDKHQYSVARTFALKSGFAPAILVSPNFSADAVSGATGRLGWQLVDLPDRGSAIKSTGVLGAFASPGGDGGVGSKVLYLNPGVYQIITQFGEVRLPGGSSVEWRISCLAAGDPRPIWSERNDKPNTRARRAATLAIPADCPVQLLELTMAGGDNADGAEVEIRGVELRPVR